MPEPLSYTAAVYVDGYIYVAGGKNDKGSTNAFYRINIHSNSGAWEKLPNFPGPPRAVHAMAVQETSTAKKIFVIGGRNEMTGKKSVALSGYLSYDLKTGDWKEEGKILIHGEEKVVMGASVAAKGSMHILVYGGSDEKLFDKIERLSLEERRQKNDSLKAGLIQKRKDILNHHPGFQKEVLAYNTITHKWFVYDTLEGHIPVTALSFKRGDDFLIVSGEVSPGIRTPEVLQFSTGERKGKFGWLNYAVLFLYLMLSLAIGIYFSRKQKSTEDYFVGGGRIPWWASGLSVFGTLLSAITFMAIPAKAFITDWSYFFLNIAAIAITPLIAFLFIPYFNRLKIRTAYEFLEDRFNYLARALGSLSFILFQLGRIGIVLLLPSLAISIVTGISVETSILIMGIICIAYTTFGGIEAVIWTDVLQVIVLLGGSVLAVVWILLHTETPFGEMISYASEQGKFNIADLDFDFTESTFWVVFIGGLASAMVTQGTDQTIVQRYLTSRSVKDSQKTLYTNAVLTLPATIIFFGIGTLLFIFYTEMPNSLSPEISNNDSIFPWYIVNELPVGVSGLLIAGIFSAAMSSISSSLNSVSTAFCNDFYKHYNPKTGDLKLLKTARWITVLTGLVGVILALWMANSGIKSLWDQFYRFLGLFTGGLGGMFLLGMLTKTANSRGTLTGLVLSGILIWFVSVYTAINFLMYALLGLVSCFVFGYMFSMVLKEKNNEKI
ncbi:sodium:solute symporter family transporter [Sinomicrobium sp.]